MLVRGNIINTRRNNPTQVAFKNCAPFIKCITKINGLTIADAEDLDMVMPMYNLVKCSSNYSDMTGSGFILETQLLLILILKTLTILSLSSINLNY